jgi:hypothetical protein
MSSASDATQRLVVSSRCWRLRCVSVGERQSCTFRSAENNNNARGNARSRRTARTVGSRGDPDDDPGPGRAGLPELRVIPPAEFRRQLDAALRGRR